jgi:hypothetical protein
MNRCHDIIEDIDEYASKFWKEQIDVWEIGMIFIFIQMIFSIFMTSKHITWAHVQWGE